MKTNITPIIAMFICFMTMAILYISNNLSEQMFWILVFGAILCLLWYYNTPQFISFEEARRLVLKTARELQRAEELEDGTIRLMPETELKHVLLDDGESPIEPFKWDIGLKIEGSETYGYIFSVSLYGAILGVSEIDLPSEYSVKKEPFVKTYHAKKIATKKELRDKARKKVEEVSEDD